jgi:hypothetical protein
VSEAVDISATSVAMPMRSQSAVMMVSIGPSSSMQEERQLMEEGKGRHCMLWPAEVEI